MTPPTGSWRELIYRERWLLSFTYVIAREGGGVGTLAKALGVKSRVDKAALRLLKGQLLAEDGSVKSDVLK